MLRAIFSGVAGLRNHQLRMDVIGNNIANLNTVGFKSGRVLFSEAYSQLLQAASPGDSTRGGTNPLQVGLGSQVASMDDLFTQGNLETTGLGTDLAIQGDGFFILGSDKGYSYTRDGAFSFDAQGRLVDPSTGRMVQGFMADGNGNIAPGTSLSGIQLNLDASTPAKATSGLVIHGNLDSTAAAGATTDVTTSVYDSLGNQHTLTLEFTKDSTNANTWNVTVKAPTGATGGTGSVTFNTDGSFKSSTVTDITIPGGTTGAADTVIKFAGATTSPFAGLTQSAGDSSAFVFSQDGYAAGSIVRTSIDPQGHVVASFSNGATRTLAQIAMARFVNNDGLTKGDGNSYEESLNSGRAVVGQAGSGSFGSIAAGALESSNVDLAQEFTDMIVAQRGFQANARMITTGDEMLTEVVNIKR